LSPAVTRHVVDEELFERASTDGFASLDLVERDILLKRGGLPLFCDFCEPLHNAFAYEWNTFNAKHPVAIELLKAVAFSLLLTHRRIPDRDLELLIKDCLPYMRDGLLHLSASRKLNSAVGAILHRAQAMGLMLENKNSVAAEEIISVSHLGSTNSNFGSPYKA
ncbi:MAG TPA: hypothetical protein VF179_10490, partial [Thermoanaerobaculia bacterium]|nr:hypothetical protein [Thermoanaerobaculia bacterium]